VGPRRSSLRCRDDRRVQRAGRRRVQAGQGLVVMEAMKMEKRAARHRRTHRQAVLAQPGIGGRRRARCCSSSSSDYDDRGFRPARSRRGRIARARCRRAGHLAILRRLSGRLDRRTARAARRGR
jgi:hypothetical protein